MLKAKYIRVSTKEQNIERQIENNYTLYIDEVSGLIPFRERKSAKKLIADIKMKKVNLVVIQSIDRLGRDIFDIQKQLNWFIENGVQIFCENIQMYLLNSDGSINLITKLIIDLLSSISNLEIEAIRERQSQGIKIAKIKGVYKGRKLGAVMSKENYLKRHKDIISLLNDGISISKTSKLTGKAYTTVKRVKKALST
ncbi:recombinase family protein [Tenacibaculum sp. IMCC1]|nr:transposase [Tenacibaculum sp. KUL118]